VLRVAFRLRSEATSGQASIEPGDWRRSGDGKWTSRVLCQAKQKSKGAERLFATFARKSIQKQKLGCPSQRVISEIYLGCSTARLMRSLTARFGADATIHFATLASFCAPEISRKISSRSGFRVRRLLRLRSCCERFELLGGTCWLLEGVARVLRATVQKPS